MPQRKSSPKKTPAQIAQDLKAEEAALLEKQKAELAAFKETQKAAKQKLKAKLNAVSARARKQEEANRTRVGVILGVMFWTHMDHPRGIATGMSEVLRDLADRLCTREADRKFLIEQGVLPPDASVTPHFTDSNQAHDSIGQEITHQGQAPYQASATASAFREPTPSRRDDVHPDQRNEHTARPHFSSAQRP